MFLQFDRPVPGQGPVDGLRNLVFLANLSAQETTGDAAVSMSAERLLHRLRGSPSFDSVAFALIDAPFTTSERSTLGYPVIASTESSPDLGAAEDSLFPDFHGFLILGLPLREDADVLDVEVILDVDHLPVPGSPLEEEGSDIFGRLLAEAEVVAQQLGRRVLQTWLLHSPEQPPGTGEFAQLLLDAGYHLGLTEVQGYLTVPTHPSPVPEGLNFYTIADLDFPTPLVSDVLQLYRLGSTDVPIGNLKSDRVEWTTQRLEEAVQQLKSTHRQKITVVATDISGVVGLTEITRHEGSAEDIAEQDLTVVAPRVRGQGIARALKNEMLTQVSLCWPSIARVYTSCAVENIPMLRVNESLGWQIISGGSGWQKTLNNNLF